VLAHWQKQTAEVYKNVPTIADALKAGMKLSSKIQCTCGMDRERTDLGTDSGPGPI